MKCRDRRDFLQSSVAVSAGALAFGRHAKAVHQDARSQKIRLGFIGVGGRGGSNLDTLAKDPGVEVVALCDVDRRKIDAAKRKYSDARTYEDFRTLYSEADDLDGLVVSTTEHTHAYATMPALKMGKHVYCEKPLTHNVFEARAITKAAKTAGVVTQMGTQLHASDNYHRIVEAIQSGAIGQVREAHVWVDRAWGRQSKEEYIAHKDRVYVTERPTEEMAVPEYLNWDLWLGPAAWRPYNEIYFPGPNWYRWWEFGNGTMSDLGSHWNDLPYWALKLDAPTSILGGGPDPHPELAPASMTAEYQYNARGELAPCKLTWYQGKYKPNKWQEKVIPQWKSGVLFEGDKGMLLADYRNHVLLPEDDFKDFLPPAQTLPTPPSHHQEWLDAIRTGSPTGSPFSYAGPLTEANHLGNVAFRTGERIQWDSASMKITNNSSANRFLSRTPREGWML